MIYFLFSCMIGFFSQAQTQQLSEDPSWKALLHYRSSFYSSEKSEIGSSDFFLSSNGKWDSHAELTATIEAMGLPEDQDVNQHAQCRFPARLLWFKKKAPEIAKKWTSIRCPHYLAFTHNNSIESISLIFATGYLSNPASYFGHPLIKFNLSRSQTPSPLLDVSVNYGAVTPPNENAFVYAFKGLFGGYHATFSHRQFYYNNHAYGEIELRDMWEYQLHLTPSEVESFYSQIWEVLGKEFPYYFFSNNCASAVAQIMDDVLGVKLIPSFVPYSAPYTVFDNLMTQKKSDGSPLVTSVRLIPSRQTRMISRFNNLKSHEKTMVNRVVNESHVSESMRLLDTDERTKVIETLFDYYSFLQIADQPKGHSDPDHAQYAQVKKELLIERLQLPVSSQNVEVDYGLKPPHEGPRPLLTRVGAVNSKKFGQGFEFQFRATYYDLLSLDYGRAKNTEVRTLDTTLDYINNQLWLKKLDLIAVSTLNLSQTGLPGDGGWAWHFVTGLETLNLSCQDCLLYKVEAGYGKAALFLDRQLFFVMLDARAQTLTAGSDQLAVTPKAGVLIDWLSSGLVKTELNIGYRNYIGRQEGNANLVRAETRLTLHRDWDLRLAYDKHVDEVSRLSFSYYW